MGASLYGLTIANVRMTFEIGFRSVEGTVNCFSETPYVGNKRRNCAQEISAPVSATLWLLSAGMYTSFCLHLVFCDICCGAAELHVDSAGSLFNLLKAEE
jgi:hypothetical protein